MLTVEEGIGIALALFGNLLVSASLNLQKHVHNVLSELKETTPTKKSQLKYSREPLWWLGLILMLLGEIGNFMAFGFAPTSVVSPLGATTVVSNAIIATKMLKEPFGRSDLAGIILTVIGGVTFVSFAPSPSASQVRLDVSELAVRFSSINFICFVALVLALTGSVLYLSKLRKGYFARRHVWIYVSVCSLLGSITVVSLKAFSGLLQLEFSGKHQFYTVGPQGFLPYGLMIIVVSTGILQIRYLQKAMEAFGSSQVVPVYYILFTLCTMSGGAIVYNEFTFFDTAYESALFFFGFLCIILGVWIISSKGRKLWWAPCLYTPLDEERTALRRRRGSMGSKRSHGSSGSHHGHNDHVKLLSFEDEKNLGVAPLAAVAVEDDVHLA